MLNSYFPYVISDLQFLKKFTRYHIKLLNQIKNKENLFNLFLGKRIKIFLDRALPIIQTIENYFSHASKLAYMRTFRKVKLFFSVFSYKIKVWCNIFQSKLGIGFYQPPEILSVKIIDPVNSFGIIDFSQIPLGGR